MQSPNYKKVDTGTPYVEMVNGQHAALVIGAEQKWVYSGDALVQGYQIVRADADVRVGDFVAVGSGCETAPMDDPRPLVMYHRYGADSRYVDDGLKVVAKNWRPIVHIGRRRKMTLDRGGRSPLEIVDVRRIYLDGHEAALRMYFDGEGPWPGYAGEAGR